jgi:ATP-dependent DNA ligase
LRASSATLKISTFPKNGQGAKKAMPATSLQELIASLKANTSAAKPPAAPDWVHEIKHDGYRLIARRDGDAVRLNGAPGGSGAAADA